MEYLGKYYDVKKDDNNVLDPRYMTKYYIQAPFYFKAESEPESDILYVEIENNKFEVKNSNDEYYYRKTSVVAKVEKVEIIKCFKHIDSIYCPSED